MKVRIPIVVKLVAMAVLIVVVHGLAQTPTPTPQQQEDPCGAVKLQMSILESELATERLRSETSGAKREEVERDLAANKARLEDTQQQLGSEQANSGRLLKEGAQQRVTIQSLTRERDALALKVKKANGRWICEVFHIGCID